ncbi:hypothetical protein Hanom_Chr11g01007111 [Helianthus anomalus]
MRTRQSSRSRRLLEILRVYEAAEGLLLLANLPPLEVTGNEEPPSSAFHAPVGSGYESRRPGDTSDEGDILLSADALMERFPANRRGGFLLVYRRRNIRRSSSAPGDQIAVAAGDGPTIDPLS